MNIKADCKGQSCFCWPIIKKKLCLSSLELPRATRLANNLPKEWDTRTKLWGAVVHTCDNIPVSVLHAVLILLGWVPRCRLSLKEALNGEKAQQRSGHQLSCRVGAVAAITRQKRQLRVGSVETNSEQRQGGGSRCHSQTLPLGAAATGALGGATAATVWLPHFKVSISSSWGEK